MNWATVGWKMGCTKFSGFFHHVVVVRFLPAFPNMGGRADQAGEGAGIDQGTSGQGPDEDAG